MKNLSDKNLLDWSKGQGLIPAIIQEESTQEVLMLGYMNAESLEQTLNTGRVTFFSRSKNRLWVKGETSGNYLNLKSWKIDCDKDTLLFQVKAQGPACHTGENTCFGESDNKNSIHFLAELENIISERWEKSGAGNANTEKSYVANLAAQGFDRIAQKVGEEAIEVIIAAKNQDINDFNSEAADLIFHLMVLLKAKSSSLFDVTKILSARNTKMP